MTPTLLLLLALFVSVQGGVPCIDYSAVCVPAQALQRGCHCALIRPGQEVSARQTLRSMFGRRKRDAYDDIRFAILRQNGVNELNRFFSPAESQPVGVDNNVFARINTQVHVSLMTVPRGLVQQVVDMQGEWLSPESRSQLLHCGQSKCEVVGQMTDLLGSSAPTRQDRKFRVNRAVRYDVDGEDTLIAFASATSDFFLNKKLVQWEEKKCKRRWYGKKKCWNESRRREDLREFDDATRGNWMNHVNREMVSKFRINNSNLLV
ncbi:hypothetical protein QR680_005788 [Steinernema hermaphroditum]|uniref:NTR domain-containing protein n=1 Tax=Steinernema hermaphroditum TaxID=289476 RepID=A0AA39HTD9_9BILA|nr:hypothetical protein QR680_005788 [Steinernema hermaphroditum]